MIRLIVNGTERQIDAGRLRHVIEVAAGAAGWDEKRPHGHALGRRRELPLRGAKFA